MDVAVAAAVVVFVVVVAHTTIEVLHGEQQALVLMGRRGRH